MDHLRALASQFKFGVASVHQDAPQEVMFVKGELSEAHKARFCLQRQVPDDDTDFSDTLPPELREHALRESGLQCLHLCGNGPYWSEDNYAGTVRALTELGFRHEEVLDGWLESILDGYAEA